jgi:hypothetical protein
MPGAPTVGVSLWSVADKSTADLMTEFYKRLLASEGVSSSAAMRDAQLSMIAGKKYSAPFYWSALCARRRLALAASLIRVVIQGRSNEIPPDGSKLFLFVLDSRLVRGQQAILCNCWCCDVNNLMA